ncbi:MAG: DUF4430 domain-containing protein [Firmicutes bacterium]|nr:DUF4430 domain-containing protein [Bacillota bacterium]
MEEKHDFQKELAKNLRKKRIRRIVLGVIAIAAVIYTASIFSIEGKDALLPDGQGNIVDYQQEQQVQEEQQTGDNIQQSESDELQQDDETQTDVKQEDVSDNQSAEEDQADEPEQKPADDRPTKEEAKDMTAEELKVDNSKDPTASNDGNRAYKPDVPEPVTVTISISCETLSSDMSKLETESIRDYIPEDGWILKDVVYQGTTDNTVFDVLNTVCRNNGVHMEFSFTPVYESNYIEGINYLYEFDGGPLSGWMYKVNGWFPNYGCSSYYLRDGDVIEWVYTCDLGKDVGDNSMA